MIVSSLQLTNFRNYEKQLFSFSPSITVIIGPNAVGKTNILEAIYTLATAKSFRAERDSDMVRWQKEIARIKSVVSISESEEKEGVNLEMVITTGVVHGVKTPVKKYLVNGVARRQIDFVEHLRAVHFCPEDLELVTDSPSIRRKYLNEVLTQVDREYRRNLVSYEKGLRQRNKLLERIHDGQATRSQLLFWNQLLIKAGSYLTHAREQFIASVNSYTIDELYYQVLYDPSIISEARLLQYAEEEIAAKTTLVGPQRDDFVVTKSQIPLLRSTQWDFGGQANLKSQLNTIEMNRFGSRGEQRLAVLWLKLAELTFIDEKTGERPILLLDDIFSELDMNSRDLVLSVTGQQQTIITSTEESILDLFKKWKNTQIIRLPVE